MVCLSPEYYTKDRCRMAKIQDKAMNMKISSEMACMEGRAK